MQISSLLLFPRKGSRTTRIESFKTRVSTGETFFMLSNTKCFPGSIRRFKGEKTWVFTPFGTLLIGSGHSEFELWKSLPNITFLETPVLRRIEMVLKITTIRHLEDLFALKEAFLKHTHVSMLLFPLFGIIETHKIGVSYLLPIYSCGLRSIL